MGDIKFIANPSVDASEISRDNIQRIFLLTEKSLGKTSHLVPVLNCSGAAYQIFLKRYIGKTDEALKTYYRNLLFMGRAPMPIRLYSDGRVAEYVANTKGAIGYVNRVARIRGVKILVVK